MDTIQICYCILIIAGAFALLSLGLFFIQSSSAIKEATFLMKMFETTVTKFDTILDDVDKKMDMLNAPVELVSGIFSRSGMRAGLLSGLGLISSVFRRKKNKKGDKEI